MKILIIVFILVLTSCSEAPEQEVEKPVVAPKTTKQDNVLKGYQDNIQRAKDMEKEVLKAAERQKKSIDDATK